MKPFSIQLELKKNSKETKYNLSNPPFQKNNNKQNTTSFSSLHSRSETICWSLFLNPDEFVATQNLALNILPF